MAKTPKLKCEIINIVEDPLHSNRTLVSVRIDDGNKILGPFVKAFSLLKPDTPITMDEFINTLISRGDLQRPIDPFAPLREAMENHKQFDVNLTDRLDSEDQNASNNH